MGEDACVALVLFTPAILPPESTLQYYNTTPHPRFTHVKREMYIVGMTLAVNTFHLRVLKHLVAVIRTLNSASL